MPSGSIIVADDDAAIRTVLHQALARAGYEVRATGQAATLWTWAAQGLGDLIITDVVMPDGNAFDILPRIKRVRPDVPIIVMSAQNTFMTAIRASERGPTNTCPSPSTSRSWSPSSGARCPARAGRVSMAPRPRTRRFRSLAAPPRCRRSTGRSRA